MKSDVLLVALPVFSFADISTRDGCAELVETVTKICPSLHAACLIAGADTLTGSSATLPFEDKLQLLYETDIQSTLLLGRGLGHILKGHDGSSIVTTDGIRLQPDGGR